jgi:ammonium transporter Rh
MIFVGFGFLMVFLKTYSWTAVAYNYLIAAFIIPMAILFTGFWHQAFAGHWHKIELSIATLINADFACAVHLITFGVILGRVSLPQLFVIASIETLIWAFNEALIIVELKATDIGGSIVLHMFGAYFGLAASYFLQAKKSNNHPNNVSSYTSNLIAFIGTIFLFMYWPSFNAALSTGASQQRAIINTYLAICASTVSACVMSRVVHNKLDIEIVLNSTIAGGVVKIITIGYRFLCRPYHLAHDRHSDRHDRRKHLRLRLLPHRPLLEQEVRFGGRLRSAQLARNALLDLLYRFDFRHYRPR